jgi:hypothetical protein
MGMAKIKDLDEGMRDLTDEVKDARNALKGDPDYGEAADELEAVAESAQRQADRLRRLDDTISGKDDEQDEDEDEEEPEDEE